MRPEKEMGRGVARQRHQSLADGERTSSTFVHGLCVNAQRTVPILSMIFSISVCTTAQVLDKKALRETQTLRTRRSPPPIDTQSPRWL